MRKITLIAAVAQNGVIGANGNMPWHIPDDLKFFRHIVCRPHVSAIMGRGTWNSLPARIRPLPQCRNIVLSARTVSGRVPYVPANSVEQALELAGDAVFIIGGAAIYKIFLPHATDMLITIVEVEPWGDRFFPFSPDDPPHDWCVQSVRCVARQGNIPSHRFIAYTKVHARKRA